MNNVTQRPLEAASLSATKMVADYGADPAKAFLTLYRAAKASPHGVAYLGETEAGTRGRFASVSLGAKSQVSVVVQETLLVKCPVTGRPVAPGDVTGVVCIDKPKNLI